MSKAKDKILEGIKDSDVEILDFIWYGGDSTYENGNALIDMDVVKKADMIFAVGGGHVNTWQMKWINHYSASQP